MLKRILIPGLLGAVVVFVCTAISNVVFGFANRLTMQPLPSERIVYEMLKANISTPGVYLCNPAFTPGQEFPANEPVFAVLYSGIGHESAALGELIDLSMTLFAVFLAAWLLSLTSVAFFSRFGNRVLFIAALGALIAVFGDLNRFGIGGFPLEHALILMARTMVTWILVGVTMAWGTRHLAGQTVPEKL